MRVRAHHLRYFFVGLLALVGLQIALFDKIFECAGNADEGIPLPFHNFPQKETEVSVDDNADEDFEAASGCILVCDDNHFLIGKLTIMNISCVLERS